MRWLLDTNVISEGARPRPNKKVTGWLAQLAHEDVAISALSLAELRAGEARARDEVRQARVRYWLDNEIFPAFGDLALPITIDVLIDWLDVARRLRQQGKSRDPVDLLLAATARVHDLILVTRNIRDFADTGLIVYDPWTDQTHRMDAP